YSWSWIRSPGVNVPLVSTTSIVTPRAGALGEPGTSVLSGSNVSYDNFSGLRGEVGTFLDEGRTTSVEAVALWLLPNHERFSAVSDAGGNPAILRPVFNVADGTEVALIDALPGIASGQVDVDYRS